MPCRLILNADDFGLTRGINCAIAELHRAGVLTSATLMANGPAFEDAVAVAHALPSLGVGCHVVLVDGVPVSDPSKIPTLLGLKEGRGTRVFRRSPGAFVRDLLLGRIDAGEMALEAEAQVAKLRSAGIQVTHVDTHKHLQMFPAVARMLAQSGLAPAIRNPFEPAFARRLPGTSIMRRVELACLSRLRPSFDRLTDNMLTTDGTVGIAATGTLDAVTLRRLLSALPVEGAYELCCHPGYADADLAGVRTRLRRQREVEREALLSIIPRMLSLPNAPELIHYGNLGYTASRTRTGAP